MSDMVSSSGENEEHRYRESVLQLYFTKTQTREDANQKFGAEICSFRVNVDIRRTKVRRKEVGL